MNKKRNMTFGLVDNFVKKLFTDDFHHMQVMGAAVFVLGVLYADRLGVAAIGTGLAKVHRTSPKHGVVYLGIMNGKLYAIDAKTGDDIWVYTAGSAVSDSPSILESWDTKTLVFGAHNGVLYDLDAKTGGDGRRGQA